MVAGPPEVAQPGAALVPTALRELLGLMGKLAELPPVPAGDDGWEARSALELRRRIMLQVRIASLADQLAICDLNPAVAPECLDRHCQLSAASLREELAKPLGYEPEPEGEAPAGR